MAEYDWTRPYRREATLKSRTSGGAARLETREAAAAAAACGGCRNLDRTEERPCSPSPRPRRCGAELAVAGRAHVS